MLRHSLPLLFIATLSFTACESPAEEGEGEAEAEAGETGDELSFAADIQPIFDDNCGCHASGSIGDPLFLLPDGYAPIVDVESIEAAGVDYVEPGSSADSYLIAKLRGTQMQSGGSGVQMPMNADPLPEATIATIEAWIDAGAPP
jgi:hypothetical protein